MVNAPRLAAFGLRARLLLGWLWRFPYQRPLDLAVALPARTSRLDDSLVLRNLALLREAGLIETVRLACVDAALFRLTERGAREVESLGGGSRPPLPPLLALPRLLRLQQAVLGLSAYAPQHLAAHFRGQAPHLAWHLVREALLPSSNSPGTSMLWLACPVEAEDLGETRATRASELPARPVGAATMSAGIFPPAWGYGAYVLHSPHSDPRAWARLVLAQVARARAVVRCPFPTLILLRDGAHARYWQQAARSLSAARQVQAEDLTGATTVLSHEMTGFVDPWRLTWHRLTDGAPVRLAALMTPVPVTHWPEGLVREMRETAQALQPLRGGRKNHAACVRAAHPATDHGIDLGERAANEARAAPLLVAPPGPRDAGQAAAREAQPEDTDRPADGARRTRAALLLPDLGARYLALLLLLARLPLVRLADLADLAALPPASVTRYLSVCVPLVDQVREETGGEADTRYQLNEAGQRFVAGLDGVSLATIARLAATVRTSDAEADVDGTEPAIRCDRLHVYEALAIFVRHAEGIGGNRAGQGHEPQGVILCGWDVAPLCCRRFLWHRAWWRFCPDAEVRVSYENRQVVLWLLDQCGGLRDRDLVQTCETLVTFLRAREDRVEGLPLPLRLLVLVKTREQEMRVAEVTGATLPTGLLVRVHTTLAAPLLNRGPFAAIWRQVYPVASTSEQRRQFLFA